MSDELFQPAVSAAQAIGTKLREARRQRFPGDAQGDFARRLGISRATYQKMEAGQLGVALGSYLRAAQLLGILDQVAAGFEPPKPSLFERIR